MHDGFEGFESGVAIAEYFAGYRSAQKSRFRKRRDDLPRQGSGADYHLRSDYKALELREIARDIDRNDSVVSQAIGRVVANVVQRGMTCVPTTPDEKLNKDLSARWVAWADDPRRASHDWTSTFHDLEQAVFRAQLVDGDIFSVPGPDESIEIVEAHRLRTPDWHQTARGGKRKNLVHGVLLGETGKHEQYWILRNEIDPWKSVAMADVVPVAVWKGKRPNALQIVDRKRVSQTRGVTVLAPIIDPISMLEDTQLAQMLRAQVASFFALVRERPDAAPATAPPALGPRDVTTTAGQRIVTDKIAPGMEYIGEPGEKLTGFSPRIPNPEYFQHVTMVTMVIAANLGLPMLALLLDARATNYSGYRAAMLEARKQFELWQSDLQRQFHRPVYRWQLDRWAAEDSALAAARERFDEDFYRHRWRAGGWRYIEPLKEAQAHALQIETGTKNLSQVHDELGVEFEDQLEEAVSERLRAAKRAIEASRELEEDTGELVSWREFLPSGYGFLPAPTPSQPKSGVEDETETAPPAQILTMPAELEDDDDNDVNPEEIDAPPGEELDDEDEATA